MSKDITQKWIDKMVPVAKSDLEHDNKELTDENIKRSLYHTVILMMNEEDIFGHQEKEDDGTSRVGLYIKGYVRDVWSYLEEAYDLIHDQSYDPKKIRDNKIDEVLNEPKK